GPISTPLVALMLEIRKTTTNTVTNHGYRVDCTGMNRMLSPLFSAVAVADLLVMKYIFAPEVVTWKLCIFRHTARTPKQRRTQSPARSLVATAASRTATLRVQGVMRRVLLGICTLATCARPCWRDYMRAVPTDNFSC